MKGFSIIVAFDEMRGIGKGGVLPWHLPADLKHFKEITTSKPGQPENVVIMGRKTWESIPEKFRPLPGRMNVVISGQAGYPLPDGVHLASSLEGAISTYCGKGFGEVFVIGGARVFAEAIDHPLCDKLHLTIIEGCFNADVLFPEIPSVFVEADRSGKYQENEKIFSFLTLVRQMQRP
jgi:dihydrofolate reductase